MPFYPFVPFTRANSYCMGKFNMNLYEFIPFTPFKPSKIIERYPEKPWTAPQLPHLSGKSLLNLIYSSRHKFLSYKLIQLLFMPYIIHWLSSLALFLLGKKAKKKKKNFLELNENAEYSQQNHGRFASNLIRSCRNQSRKTLGKVRAKKVIVQIGWSVDVLIHRFSWKFVWL